MASRQAHASRLPGHNAAGPHSGPMAAVPVGLHDSSRPRGSSLAARHVGGSSNSNLFVLTSRPPVRVRVSVETILVVQGHVQVPLCADILRTCCVCLCLPLPTTTTTGAGRDACRRQQVCTGKGPSILLPCPAQRHIPCVLPSSQEVQQLLSTLQCC